MAVESFELHKERAAVAARIAEIRACGHGVLVLSNFGDWAVVDVEDLGRVIIDPMQRVSPLIRRIEKRMASGIAPTKAEALILLLAHGEIA